MKDDKPDGTGLPYLWGPIRDVLCGITLPVRVANSLYKAADRIILAGAEVPAAWLESIAQGMRRASSAKDIVAHGAADAAAKQFDAPELAQRALARYGADIIRQQANLESVFRKATEEIASEPPQQDSAEEIDEDWLSRFYNEASKTSDENMQTYLGKILAGEIKQPGSFSIRSVLTLCMINKNTAKYFEDMCNMTCVVTKNDVILIWEPFGNPGSNSMSDLHAPYEMFVDLAQNDLIMDNFNTSRPLLEHIEKKAPFELAGRIVWLAKKEDKEVKKMEKVQGVKLTRAGQELRVILSLQWNEAYVHILKGWFNENGVDLFVSMSRQGNRLRGIRL